MLYVKMFDEQNKKLNSISKLIYSAITFIDKRYRKFHPQIWGLTVHSLLYSFPGEHPRSSFFKNIGQVMYTLVCQNDQFVSLRKGGIIVIICSQGVTQLHVDSAGRLFSCGADGSMKVRQLPERDCVIQTLY